MSTTPLRLVVIIGSVRPGRFGPVVARWITDQAEQHGGFSVELVDLADIELRHELSEVPIAMDPDPQRPDGMRDLTAALAAADAFVFVTPEYNGSYPAALKTMIDWHYLEWGAKAAAFVGYGAGGGAQHAIDHLREILGQLDVHAVNLPVTFPNYWHLFDTDGALHDPSPHESAATAMLDRLQWWGSALAEAREPAEVAEPVAA